MCVFVITHRKRRCTSIQDAATTGALTLAEEASLHTHPKDEVFNLYFPLKTLYFFHTFMCSLQYSFSQCLSTLRELRISYHRPEPGCVEGMVVLLTTFPSVERLSLVLKQSFEHDESPLWRALTAECMKPGVVLFPALQHLTIREAIIRGTAVDFLSMWLSCLDGLLTVHLEECRFESEDVWKRLRDHLQQHVAEVTCATSGWCAQVADRQWRTSMSYYTVLRAGKRSGVIDGVRVPCPILRVSHVSTEIMLSTIDFRSPC